MKQIICYVVFIITFAGVSCKEKVSKELHLVLVNSTDHHIDCQLDPKDGNGPFGFRSYKMSDFGNGNLPAEFSLTPKREHILFYSNNVNQNPEALLQKLFLEMKLTLFSDEKEHKLYFSIDALEGYKSNPFESSAAWSHEVRQSGRETQFLSRPIEAETYLFTISEENIVKE